MTPPSGFRFLRPFLHKTLRPSRNPAYLRFHSAARCANPAVTFAPGRRSDVKQRTEELVQVKALSYPRIEPDERAIDCKTFRSRYACLSPNETRDDIVTLRGRVYSSRIAGSKLVFVDIVQNNSKVQGLLNFQSLETVTEEQFRDFWHLIRRGDIISVTGHPSKTKRGELSINAVDLPVLLAPSLATLPTELQDRETRIRNRHVDLLVNQRVGDTLKLRSHIIQYIRNFFLEDRFLEVQTPLMTDGAGGAAARPFITHSTEFPERALTLRIAPELWLKRLIIGGMDRVFEIGPAFRNEGLDATHNPEFTTCEFYKAFAELEELMAMTESLISGMAQHASKMIDTELFGLDDVDASRFAGPFRRIRFIPALQRALGCSLPNLEAEDATEKILAVLNERGIWSPKDASLSQLLDKLASVYLEPQCKEPTFITHHPACMAPLAKSFHDPESSGQLVSARVELFINEREMANMYEEENSPFEQRRKFEEQAKLKDENAGEVDEGYLEAMESGLPPTGGWGCGIDRLVMLFSGSKRISDVLSFGSLRNVVGLRISKDIPGPQSEEKS